MTARPTRTTPKWLLNGVLPIDMPNVPSEVIAGCTLAALGDPRGDGLREDRRDAGRSPACTRSSCRSLLFALFGSSRHLVVGADSATAAILATGLAGLAADRLADSTSPLAGLAALMCAACCSSLARVLKLGFIANFLSRSVLIGFLTGVGIQVAMGQFGGHARRQPSGSRQHARRSSSTRSRRSRRDEHADARRVGRRPRDDPRARAVNRKIPGALIAVVGAIVVSYVARSAAHGRDRRWAPCRAACPPSACRRGLTVEQRRGPAADRRLDRSS